MPNQDSVSTVNVITNLQLKLKTTTFYGEVANAILPQIYIQNVYYVKLHNLSIVVDTKNSCCEKF